ncbi:CPXCG motif-containing cysteine-rich protein [Microbulbifer discodermiae]|uniref:CPXCG motif-containing cysteine-rich protein n=1 Tax=Microbulbifer sp. 2201CG32-9 TaxID=3232309 RepID=UPI00345BED01
MGSLEETTIYCPYCGESITVLINGEEVGQEYIEDCQVCCKPIIFNISMGMNGDLSVSVREENETY